MAHFFREGLPKTDGHCFISYSSADALEFARQLADELEGGEDKYTNTWFDKRDIDPARDWDDQVVDAIRSCKCMLFVMTKDSTTPGSMCKNEWTWALRYKKPVVPIRLHQDAEQPFGLGNRQWIDFTGEFELGLAKLRIFLREIDSPKNHLQSMKDRLSDAQRDFRRAKPEDQPRIQTDIDELKKQIESQQKVVDNPKAAEEQTKKNIKNGIEREQQPEKPITVRTYIKFINPPPGIAPMYFQDRYFETEQIVDFLRNEAQRLMTIIGRVGIGKTATICRLLKELERCVFPDNLGGMKVDGIVYLSEAGSHKINFANIFYDLCKLLPAETAQELDSVYKNPQTSTESKMYALMDYFQGERVILLLDNFEPLVNDDVEYLPLRDTELGESLRAFLNGPYTAVNIIITSRVPPRELNGIQPGRQRVYHIETGLEPKYAEKMLREMDIDGILSLNSADEKLLDRTYERTRGFPKALEALYQILSSDRYTTLEELLTMPTPENVVEALVGEAFNRLDKNAQNVMQGLSVYNRPVPPAAVDYLLAPHLPAIDSAPILQRLANMHFVRKESGKFYLHPIDREFAYNLIPEDKKILEEPSTHETEFLITGSEGQFEDTETMLENGNKEETTEVSFDEIGFENLFKQSRFRESHTDFTHYGLLDRAADYYAQARKPRTEWKELDDLSAQLAEFDLRCEAGEYDTAASVLLEIDGEYLLLWGHYRLTIDLHKAIEEKIRDTNLRMGNLNVLGIAYGLIGVLGIAISYLNKGLALSQEVKDLSWEIAFLNGLGNRYVGFGDFYKATEFYEKALKIIREIGNNWKEGEILGNLGTCYTDLGEVRKAI